MSKKMIDADVLLNWVKKKMESGELITETEHYSTENVIFVDDFIEKINELATHAPEPQESIFDADGWCLDLSLIDNDNEYHFLIERTVANIGYVKANRKTYYQTIGYFDFIQSNLKDTYLCLGDTLKAWRPLPTLPKDKS